MELDSKFWLTVLIITTDLSILIGMVMYMTIPKPGRREYWPLAAMATLELLRDIVSFGVFFAVHVDTNPIVNVISAAAFVMIVLLYKGRIRWSGIDKISIGLIVCFSIFSIVNFFFIQGMNSWNSYTWLIGDIIVIVISIAYFYTLLQQLPSESITKLPMFWINTAMLILYSGTFFIYLAADYLIHVLNNNMIIGFGANYFFALVAYSILWRPILLIRSEYSVGK